MRRSPKRPPASAPVPPASPWIFYLQVLALVGAGLGIYASALSGGWIWDDKNLLADNPDLRSAGGLFNIWFTSPATDYWPLTWTLFWIEWHLWGNAPLGYHLTSVALHVASGFLIWRLFSRLGLRWAWLGGFLFVIHPLAVESVAWISEMKNTLSLPFFLLAIDGWMDAEEGKPSGYLRSILYFLAAMLAKTSAVMLPAVLLLYGWWKRGRVSAADVRKLIPHGAIALALGLLTIYFQNHGHVRENNPVELGGVGERLINAGTAFYFYVGKFFWPLEPLPIYPRWSLSPPTLLQLLTLPLAAAVLVALWFVRKGWSRHVLLGVGFFIITVLPVLGLVKMEYANIAWVADHLVYLPMIGLIGLVVAGLATLYGKLPAAGQPFIVGTVAVVLAGLMVESHSYAGRFVSEEALWAYTLARNPDAWLGQNNLGTVLLDQGRFAEAGERFQRAVEIAPHFADGWYNWGLALKKAGHLPEAVDRFRHALAVDPDYSQAHLNLANTLLQSGDSDQAFAEYQLAVRSDPANAEAQYDWGAALAQAGHAPEAIAHFEQAIQVNPDYLEAHFNLGAALYQSGRTQEAIAQFNEVLRINPNFSQARQILAQLGAPAAGGPGN